MKPFFAFLVAVTLFSPFFAKADMIPDGQHLVENFVSVMNGDENYAENYQDYNFYLTGRSHAGGYASLLLTAEPQQVYFDVEELIAVKKENVAKLIPGTQPNCPECGDAWFNGMENAQYVDKVNFDPEMPLTLPDTSEPDTSEVVRISQVIGATVSNKAKYAEVLTVTRTSEAGLRIAATAESESDVLGIPGLSNDLLITGFLAALGVIGLVLGVKVWSKK